MWRRLPPCACSSNAASSAARNVALERCTQRAPGYTQRLMRGPTFVALADTPRGAMLNGREYYPRPFRLT
jgi:hypothetical protein